MNKQEKRILEILEQATKEEIVEVVEEEKCMSEKMVK